VFPNGIIWSNDSSGSGYDAVLFGVNGPLKIDVDALEQRLDRQDYVDVVSSLSYVGFYSAVDLLATYAGQAGDLKEWSADAQINTDRNLRLQYLAGMWLNTYEETDILNGILKYYRFPDELFVGSEETLEELKQELNSAGRYNNY
jgi:spermidine synthase